MAFLDSIKKATGIGLNATEQYDRAFEKSVLLGPAKYAEAVGLFESAANKANEAGDARLNARALANARLYGFITSGRLELLEQLRQVLPAVDEIEQIGSHSETMPASGLLPEVEARLAEGKLAEIGASDNHALAAAHLAAADAFKRFFNAPLITYRYQHSDQHVEAAQARFFYHQGLSSWHSAIEAVGSNPETAAEHMAKALNAFRQCKDDQWSGNAETWLTNCRIKRTCWMCHREFQGMLVHFRTYSAAVTPYSAAIVAKLGQDSSSVDVPSGLIVLCGPCGSAVERQADFYAVQRTEQLRAYVDQQLAEHARTITALANRIASLESAAHRH